MEDRRKFNNKVKPTCSKCGQPHWGFVACTVADDRNEVERANAVRRASLHVVARPREGFRDYGDRTVEYDTNGYRLDVKASDRRRVPLPGGE